MSITSVDRRGVARDSASSLVKLSDGIIRLYYRLNRQSFRLMVLPATSARVPVCDRAVPCAAERRALGPASRAGRDGNAIVARRTGGGRLRFTPGQSDHGAVRRLSFRQDLLPHSSASDTFVRPLAPSPRRIKLMIAGVVIIVVVVVVGGLVFQRHRQRCT